MTKRRLRDPNRLPPSPEPRDIRSTIVDMWSVLKPFRRTITADFTADTDSYWLFIVCNNTTAITVTLPANPLDIQRFTVVRANTGGVTVDGNGSNINGASTLVLGARYDAPDIFYDEELGLYLLK